MRIKKISPTTPANGNIENQYGTSQTNAYSEEYVNSKLAEKLDAMAINNTYGTSTTEAYSQSYSNNTFASKNVENYSTNETIIGTWIDGKPLYRRTFETTSITTSNTNFITNLGSITPRKIYGILETSYSTKFPMPLTDSSSNYNVIFYTPDDNGSIRGRAVVGSGAFSKAYITIEYTKTTD